MWIVHWLLDTKVKVICSRVQLTPSFCVWLSYYSLFHLWQILLGLTLIHFNSAENLICQSYVRLSICTFILFKINFIKSGFIFDLKLLDSSLVCMEIDKKKSCENTLGMHENNNASFSYNFIQLWRNLALASKNGRHTVHCTFFFKSPKIFNFC